MRWRQIGNHPNIHLFLFNSAHQYWTFLFQTHWTRFVAIVGNNWPPKRGIFSTTASNARPSCEQTNRFSMYVSPAIITPTTAVTWAFTFGNTRERNRINVNFVRSISDNGHRSSCTHENTPKRNHTCVSFVLTSHRVCLRVDDICNIVTWSSMESLTFEIISASEFLRRAKAAMITRSILSD